MKFSFQPHVRLIVQAQEEEEVLSGPPATATYRLVQLDTEGSARLVTRAVPRGTYTSLHVPARSTVR